MLHVQATWQNRKSQWRSLQFVPASAATVKYGSHLRRKTISPPIHPHLNSIVPANLAAACRSRRWVVGVEQGQVWLYTDVEREGFCYVAVGWMWLALVGKSETSEVTGQRGTCICCEVCDWLWLVTSGPRLANRLRMFLSDIWSRTATGGILAMVAGRRVTSAFMSLRSSSSCLRTGDAKSKRGFSSTWRLLTFKHSK